MGRLLQEVGRREKLDEEDGRRRARSPRWPWDAAACLLGSERVGGKEETRWCLFLLQLHLMRLLDLQGRRGLSPDNFDWSPGKKSFGLKTTTFFNLHTVHIFLQIFVILILSQFLLTGLGSGLSESEIF